MVKSDMPGTYAPPAVALPKTTLTVGIRCADSRVRSRNTRPPGMKISACVGRSAPADSTRFTIGSRLAAAISPARRVFASDHGLIAPPRTVGSFATIRHSTPSTTPMPVTVLAPTGKSVPNAATDDSSRNGLSGSSSSSIRSRGSSLPRPWWRVTYFSPPPPRAWSSASSSSARRSSSASRLAVKAGADGSIVLCRTVVLTGPCPSR